MEKVSNTVTDAKKRIDALVSIARWIWVVNSIVGISSIVYHRYDIAALAGYTWVLSLLAAAYGRRAGRNLATVEQAIESS